MILENQILRLYDNINFYDRYESLSKKHRSKKVLLEKQDQNNVINLFNDLGYTAKYISKEKFYQIKEKSNDYEFYFHISLKYGISEIIFGVINQIKNVRIGGVSSRVCKLIKRSKGEIPEPIGPANFSSYEELTSILKESLSLYEDFKTEVLKLQP